MVFFENHWGGEVLLREEPQSTNPTAKIDFDKIKIKDLYSVSHPIDYITIWVAD
jgi:hypothetical protein